MCKREKGKGKKVFYFPFPSHFHESKHALCKQYIVTLVQASGNKKVISYKADKYEKWRMQIIVHDILLIH